MLSLVYGGVLQVKGAPPWAARYTSSSGGPTGQGAYAYQFLAVYSGIMFVRDATPEELRVTLCDSG